MLFVLFQYVYYNNFVCFVADYIIVMVWIRDSSYIVDNINRMTPVLDTNFLGHDINHEQYKVKIHFKHISQMYQSFLNVFPTTGEELYKNIHDGTLPDYTSLLDIITFWKTALSHQMKEEYLNLKYSYEQVLVLKISKRFVRDSLLVYFLEKGKRLIFRYFFYSIVIINFLDGAILDINNLSDINAFKRDIEMFSYFVECVFDYIERSYYSLCVINTIQDILKNVMY